MFANMKPIICAWEIQEGVVSGTPNILEKCVPSMYVIQYVPTCRIKHCDVYDITMIDSMISHLDATRYKVVPQ